MKKWLRWQGFGIFGVIIILISLFWFVFIDLIVANMIEKYGTEIVEAKVDLESADLSLFPMGLALKGLQVTNPDEPMTNAVQIDQMAMSLEAGHLLKRKVIIDDMTLEGLRFNTPRKTSGAVVLKKTRMKTVEDSEKKDSPFAFTLPNFDNLDAKEILENENLETLTLVKELETEIQATKDNWQVQLQGLPDEKKFQEYKTRLENLKGKSGGVMGILGAASDVQNLHKDVKKDLEALKNGRNLFEQKRAFLKNRLDQVTSAPARDFNRLKNKYTLSPQGLSNLSRLFFGPQIANYINKAITWYYRVKPYLEGGAEKGKEEAGAKKIRGRGVDVRFAEDEPVPDFLIRRIKAAVLIKAGDLQGTMENITPDQDITGLPLTFAFSGEKLKGVRALSINGILDHISPESSKDTINLMLTEYSVADLSLSKDSTLPITVKSGLADLKLNSVLASGNISATLVGFMKAVQFAGSDSQDKKMSFSGAVQDALAGVSRFSMQANAFGTLDNYDVKLTSDLDGVLKNAAAGIIKKQSKHFEKELNGAIQAKVNGPIDRLQNGLLDLGSIDKELTQRLNIGNDLLGGLKIF